MKKRLLICLLACLLICGTLGGCKKEKDPGKAFVYPIDANPVCLDPQIADDSASLAVLNNCMEGLVRLDADAGIIPGVAEHVRYDQESSTFTFTLRSDAKWHVPDALKSDSTRAADATVEAKKLPSDFPDALTADDFVFALRRALDPGTSAPAAITLYPIQNAQKVHSGNLRPERLGVRAVDAHTLEIRLESDQPDFLQVLSTAVAFPCNEAFFEHTVGRYGLNDDLLICNGPFYLSKWTESESILLKRNDDYRGQQAAVPSSVTFRVDSDPSSRLSLLRDGTYDASPLSSQSGAQVREDASLTVTEFSDTVWMLHLNPADALLSNLNLRLALCHATNLSQIEKPSSVNGWAAGLIPGVCRIGELPFRDEAGGAQTLAYSQTQASAAWSKAMKELNIKKPVLTMICPKEFEAALRPLLQQWPGMGDITSVTFKIEALEADVYARRLAMRDYQIALVSVRADNSSAPQFLNKFTSGASDNPIGYASDVYDRLAAQATASLSAQDCLAAESHLLQNGVVYPLFTQSNYFVLAKGVSGVYLSPLTGAPYLIGAERAGKD